MLRVPSALSLRLAVLGSASALAMAVAGAGSATADGVTCNRVASPNGSDSAAGTPDDPYGSANRLVAALDPGETGCLRGGTYHENVWMNNGGSDDSRIVVRSFPGERATIAGRLSLTDDADYVTFEQLNLDGHDGTPCDNDGCDVLPSPTVNGDHVIFQDNDVTNRHAGICFNLGHPGYGRPQDALIQRNRIHDCGRIHPVSNHDHGIYLAYSDNARILNNVIYDNADRGIQMYPDAQHTVIRGNIIDGNGEGVIFSGAGDSASNDNLLENNVITNSKIRHDVESWYPDIVGRGNKVRNNCVFGGKQGPLASEYGFEIGPNLRVDPQYVDRGAKDFTLSPGSPCAAILGGAELPSTPSDFRPGKQTGGGGDDTPGTTPATGARVVISRATLRRQRRHGGRWRLRVEGRISGFSGTPRGFVQAYRGGSWQRLGPRRLRRSFRVSVDPRLPAFHGARAERIRIVVPGVAKSRPHITLVRAR
jgi:parallel beta-helix repeat protein